ncbi:MAG: hypothetical protein JXR91_12075 [Deltaproteobacteria bacterium]|nr:hypothetical protein [Deltaproteobacteria bacterium]
MRGIGGLDNETNIKITEKVCQVLEENLKIDPANVYTNFFDMPRENWGWNNKTVS